MPLDLVGSEDFKTMGFGDNASLISTVITGVVNILATLVSIFTVDKVGRRALFLLGASQMFICQIVITIAIALKFGVNGNPGELPMWYAFIVVAFICLYIMAFAWSWGPLDWLVPSEILPLEVRSTRQSINVGVSMICTFVIAQIFLQMLCALRFGFFIFFMIWVVAMTLFIHFFLPETKGIPIGDMAGIWTKHWFWKRYVPLVDEEKDLEKDVEVNVDEDHQK